MLLASIHTITPAFDRCRPAQPFWQRVRRVQRPAVKEPIRMAIASRNDLRNVAIVAHVDHGKTTLVDAMLRQTNSFAEHAHLEDRAMDSNDLEREKGITILAKNTAITYRGIHATDGPITINVIDTPGHADFGGEVERGLSMVDGVVLLVDASEGPLPQTRFVLRKALEAKLPVILLVNKTDRPDARIDDVVDRVPGPAARPGRRPRRRRPRPRPGQDPRRAGRLRLRPQRRREPEQARERHPPGQRRPRAAVRVDPQAHPGADATTTSTPLQAHVTNLDASPFLGRLALLRIFNGTIHKGQTVAWVRHDGTVTNVQDHRTAEDAGAGPVSRPTPPAPATSSRSPASTRSPSVRPCADPDDVRPLPIITVDDPAISMTIGTNTSPLIGKVKGHKLTARMVKDRLDRELVGNVSIKLVDIGRPDAWEVQGRGELALAILVEQMRREGYELTVGKPQVVTKEVERQDPRAVRAAHGRRAGGVPRRGHAAAGRPQGPHGRHVQPRHRLGAHGVHRPGPRPHRLPHRVPHRSPAAPASPTRSPTATTRGRDPSSPATTGRSSPTAPAWSRRSRSSRCRSA